MNFSNVTGFSQMQFEWKYDSQWGTRHRKNRGLKEHLEYNETFYIALIKNYQDMGWLSQAEDCYYTYRKEKRKRRANHLYSIAELVFLEATFGYGVKPFKLLGSFLFLWIPFSLFCIGFLRHKWTGKSLYGAVVRDTLLVFIWALIHSINIMTPGIELHSLKDPFLRDSPYNFPEESKAVIWGQRLQQILGWYLLALFFIMFGKIWIR